MEHKPKKKGRKPKTSTTYDVINVQQNSHSIINIKHQSVEEETNQILPGYTGFTESYMDNTYNHCELCWNCCYSFTDVSRSIPLRHDNTVFYIYGFFCSYECGARYIFETMDNNKKWDIYALLNLYYNMSGDTHGKHIKLSPNKLLLERFGGKMDIETYRNQSSNVTHTMYIPPIVPIHYGVISLENKSSSDNKSNFKLCRGKPINSSNNIYDTMNLTMD